MACYQHYSPLVKAQGEFSLDVANLINFAFTKGFWLSGGEWWRNTEIQQHYVKTGRSKTLQSDHMNRLAIDFIFRYQGQLTDDLETLKVLGIYWESLHPKNYWGGWWTDPYDPYHFGRKI